VLTVLLLSIALAMDAFAVSLVKGASGAARKRDALKLGATFGLAQGLMPLVGWFLGIAFASTFKMFDHWIAFVLLSVLGGRMLLEARDPGTPVTDRRALSLLNLLVAAFATSIDAAAAGITLPLLGSSIPAACLTIGVVTGALCVAGFLVGSEAGAKVGKHAEFVGGLVLIGLGLRILIEHLSA
jgi:putative Mn2+ efflux pump MntP